MIEIKTGNSTYRLVEEKDLKKLFILIEQKTKVDKHLFDQFLEELK